MNMPIIPFRPFFDFDKFFEDEEKYLPLIPFKGLVGPAMDVYETEKDVIAEVDLPGVDPEKVEVSVKDGILKITGKTEEAKEIKEKGYWKKEIRRGAFERAVRLPAPVKEDKVDASYKDGVLKITMPKIEPSKAKKEVKIKIKKA